MSHNIFLSRILRGASIRPESIKPAATIMSMVCGLLTAAILLCFPAEAWGAKAKAAPLPANMDAKYGKWMNLPTDELIRKGREYLYRSNHPDSALVCFSIAASRYKESLPPQDKEAIYQAYTGKWYAHFFHFYDYPKAYESLREAEKISEELGKGRGMANFNMSLMYQVFGVDGRDRDALFKADVFRQKAFRTAIEEKDTNAVHLAFSNMVGGAVGKKELEELKPYVEDYRNFNKGNSNPMVDINTLIYSINEATADKDYDRALALLDRQLGFIDETQPRYLISNLMSRAGIYAAQEEYSEAERQLDEAERIARVQQMKDVLLNIYDARRNMYMASGDRARQAEAYHQFLSMKDTLINYRQVSGFNQVNFLSEMEKMDDALAQIEYKRRVQAMVAWLCVAVLIVVLALLVVIIRKNRHLSEANRSLYEKNRALLDREEKESRLQSEEEPKASCKPVSAEDEVAREKTEAMMRQIMAAAASSTEIYSPKFTISKFSEIVGLPAKTVSQVINESTGANFNSFINSYRIRHACRMLDDVDTYGGLTIENIGLNVGFRSRTAFISSFKKYTGLNPSDYLKAARQARLQKENVDVEKESGETEEENIA